MKLLLLAVLLLMLISGCVDTDCENYRKFNIGAWPFKAEVRAGQPLLALTDLPKLKETSGVIYDFETFDMHTVTMEEANAQVDLIWLDAVNRIVTISENAVPCPKGRYCMHGPDLPVKHVLVASAGFADRRGIQKGNTLELVESCSKLDEFAKTVKT